KHELESMGHRVSVFATDAGGFAEASGIYQIPAPTRMSRALSKMRRFLRRGHGSAHQVFDYSSAISESVLRIHRKYPIDVVEMDESFGWFADVARITRIPMVARLHGPAFLSLVRDELNSEFAHEKIKREGAALRVAVAITSPSRDTLVH